jgi:DNA-binding response OmpR family regulator
MSSPDARTATVLVYSSSATTRARVVNALGERPAAGIVLDLVEATRGDEVVARCDQGDIDLAILDGEAAPTGGLGLCRQLGDELDAPPPVLLLLGRRDDAWLATWSRADAVIAHPIDAVRITELVVGLLRPAAGAVATQG